MTSEFAKTWAKITKKEPQWITVHGAHIPIKDGQSPKAAISAHFGSANRKKPEPSKLDHKNMDASHFKHMESFAEKRGISIPKTVAAMKKRYELAEGCKEHVDSLADSITKEIASKMPPKKTRLKGVERAMQKAVEDYGGDASRVTDIARNTVITHDKKTFAHAIELLSKHKDVVSFKLAKADTDELGYSGGNVKVKAPNGMVGEIQVNTPDMIYGKELESVSRNILGEDVYNMIRKKVGVDGGRGHKLYEEWRNMKIKDPTNPRILELADESKKYYSHIAKHYFA